MKDTKQLPNIFLIGNRGSGKTKQANNLVKNHGYIKFSFAGKIRLAVAVFIYNFKSETNTKLNSIEETCEYYFSEPNYTYLKSLDYIPIYGEDSQINIGLRKLLQVIGSDICRKLLNTDIWINTLIQDINKIEKSPVVIDDCRFVNESKILTTTVFKNNRPTLGIMLDKPGSDGKHESEQCQRLFNNHEYLGVKLAIPYALGITETTKLIEQKIYE